MLCLACLSLLFGRIKYPQSVATMSLENGRLKKQKLMGLGVFERALNWPRTVDVSLTSHRAEQSVMCGLVLYPHWMRRFRH